MLPITGYADRLSIRPGEKLEVKISSQSALPYQVQVARVICADPNPAGPGWQETPIDAAINTSYPSRVQPHHLGSYMLADTRNAPSPDISATTLTALIYPTTPTLGIQGVMDIGPLSMFIDQLGYLCIDLKQVNVFKLTDFGPLSEREWHQVFCSYDGVAGIMTVACTGISTPTGNHLVQQIFECPATDALRGIFEVSVACLLDPKPHAFFNGKIEAPTIYSEVLDFNSARTVGVCGTNTNIYAAWDFSLETQSDRTTDVGPSQLNGVLHNSPTRAVKSSSWSGHEMCWRHAPKEYAAIHFHDDDAGDCNWQTDFVFEIPDTFKCGFYVINLENDSGKDAIPFYVCPPKGIRTADICVVIPTFTYIVYGN